MVYTAPHALLLAERREALAALGPFTKKGSRGVGTVVVGDECSAVTGQDGVRGGAPTGPVLAIQSDLP